MSTYNAPRNTAPTIYNNAQWDYSGYVTESDAVTINQVQTISALKTFASNVEIHGNLNMGNTDINQIDDIRANGNVYISGNLVAYSNVYLGDNLSNDNVYCQGNVSISRELVVNGNATLGGSFLGNVTHAGNTTTNGNAIVSKYLQVSSICEPIQTVAYSSNITIDANTGSLFAISGNVSANFIINWVNLPSISDTSRIYNATLLYQANAYAMGNLALISTSTSGQTAYVPRYSGGSGNLTVSSYGNMTCQRMSLVNNFSGMKVMSSIVPYYY